ncbi:MAG: hypothetical protein PHE20_01670 [Patescibacteria group bacterium]|nr:hypothetical protein [Patescibacteria group bacterium]
MRSRRIVKIFTKISLARAAASSGMAQRSTSISTRKPIIELNSFIYLKIKFINLGIRVTSSYLPLSLVQATPILLGQAIIRKEWELLKRPILAFLMNLLP